MKLPSAIVTRHKIRDSKICSLYATDAWTFEEIGQRFKISATRVGQIIYKNSALLEINRKYAKAKRVNHLERLLKKHPENIGTKSTLDIISNLKDEQDGDSRNESMRGGDTKIIIIRDGASSSHEIKTENIAGISIIRPAVAEAVSNG
jgi:hypothetical protein